MRKATSVRPDVQRQAAHTARKSAALRQEAATMFKAWRRRLSLTQAEAAERLQTPLGTYLQWEQARRLPTHFAAIRKLMKEKEKTRELRTPVRHPG